MTRIVLGGEHAAASAPDKTRVVLGGLSRHWMLGLYCLALVACGDSVEGEADACGASGLDFARGDAAAGAQVFSTFCARCHGADGMGLPKAPTEGTRGINLRRKSTNPLQMTAGSRSCAKATATWCPSTG